jgi:iron-sulfur cluster assembly protein
MVKFTPKAIEYLVESLKPGEIVRVGVEGGGCSGMNYKLVIETEETDGEDIKLDITGVDIYIDPYSADILRETTVHYESTLMQKGFKFINRLANTTCGCGSSFR